MTLIIHRKDDEWDQIAEDVTGESGRPWVMDERRKVLAIICRIENDISWRNICS
jgi:hypothetical protein